MIRDPLCDVEYWNEWVAFGGNRIVRMLENLQHPSGNPNYEPQYAAEFSQAYCEQIMRRYSRGDSIRELTSHFPPMLDAWEKSEALGAAVWSDEVKHIRHTWAVNFDCYLGHFWRVALALLLDIPDGQWQRLVALVGNEGEDILLDRLIASRSPNRKIGTQLCFPKPFNRLLLAVDAPSDRQAKLLKDFLEHWYPELGQIANNARTAQLHPHTQPYWYNFAKQNIEGGAYFGQWCLEAAAAVKAFGVDDSLCLGHPHYPGDFLRPSGPSTHASSTNRLVSTPMPETSVKASKPRNWMARILFKE